MFSRDEAVILLEPILMSKLGAENSDFKQTHRSVSISHACFSIFSLPDLYHAEHVKFRADAFTQVRSGIERKYG